MGLDDHRYYCCGYCQALFPTLSNLTEHKSKCDGTKIIGDHSSLYAYSGSHLHDLLECTTQCYHTNTCPLISTTVSPRKKSLQTRLSGKGAHTEQIKKGLATTNSQAPAVKEKGVAAEKTAALAKLNPAATLSTQTRSTTGQEDKSVSNPTIHVAIPSKNKFDEVQPTSEINHVMGHSRTSQSRESDSEHTAQTQTVACVGSEELSGLREIVILAPGDSVQPNQDIPDVADIEQRQDRGVRAVCPGGEEPLKTNQEEAGETMRRQARDTHKVFSAKVLEPRTSTKADLHKQWQQYKQRVPPSVDKNTSGSTYAYVCDICSWKTPHVGHFARHKRKHMETSVDNTWTCDQCDFTCEGSTKMKLHQNTHTKPFVCDCCSHRFARKKDLERHLYVHTDLLPLKCNLCDYRCRQPKSLSEHMRKHTGNLLSCPIEGCEFRSAYKWAVRQHHMSKHMPTKRLQCPQCPYKTNDSNSMVRHCRLHTGQKNYKCSLCSYRAVAKHEIVRHMRSHTKEKVYFCDRCTFSTSHSSALRLHMMNHLGVKPWQCMLCGFNSLTRSKVLRHVRQTHRGQPGSCEAHSTPEQAVVNLGLKLDIDVREYKTPHEGSNPTVQLFYQVQEEQQQQGESRQQSGEGGIVVQAQEDTVVVHEIPAENGQEYAQVVTGDEQATLELSTLEQHLTNTLQQQQQQTGNKHQDEHATPTDNTMHIYQTAAGQPVEAQLDPATQTWHIVGTASEQQLVVGQDSVVASVEETVEVVSQTTYHIVSGEQDQVADIPMEITDQEVQWVAMDAGEEVVISENQLTENNVIIATENSANNAQSS